MPANIRQQQRERGWDDGLVWFRLTVVSAFQADFVLSG